MPALGGFFLNPVAGFAAVAHAGLEILCNAFGERDTAADFAKEYPLAAYVYELKREHSDF